MRSSEVIVSANSGVSIRSFGGLRAGLRLISSLNCFGAGWRVTVVLQLLCPCLGLFAVGVSGLPVNDPGGFDIDAIVAGQYLLQSVILTIDDQWLPCRMPLCV